MQRSEAAYSGVWVSLDVLCGLVEGSCQTLRRTRQTPFALHGVIGQGISCGADGGTNSVMTGEHEHFDLNSGESREKVNVCAFVACFFKIPVKGRISYRHMLLLVAMYLSPER